MIVSPGSPTRFSSSAEPVTTMVQMIFETLIVVMPMSCACSTSEAGNLVWP